MRGVKANSLALLLLQQILVQNRRGKTSTMQKSLKGLCLLNNEIALPDSVKRRIALLLSPHPGQGLKDYIYIYFFPPSLFFGSNMRRRKLFYLVPPCAEQRADCVPGNRLSRFGSLRHKAAELCPLLNAPAVNQAERNSLLLPQSGQQGSVPAHLARQVHLTRPRVTHASLFR